MSNVSRYIRLFCIVHALFLTVMLAGPMRVQALPAGYFGYVDTPVPSVSSVP